MLGPFLFPMASYSGPYAKELQIACLTVQRAALLTKKLLESVDKGSIDKSDSTPVTIADFAAQAMIIAAIHGVFPEDEFVGEEDSKALRQDPILLQRTWDLIASTRLENEECESMLNTPSSKEEMLELIDLGTQGKCNGSGRTWTLDPVDGTATFMLGQQYAVCLALIEDGSQKVGVLGCPNLNLESGVIKEEIVDRDGHGYMISAVKDQGVSIRKMGRGALLPARKLDQIPQITDPSEIRFVDCSVAASSNFTLHGQVASRIGAPWPHMTNLWSTQMRYVAIAVGGCNATIKMPRKPKYRSNIWDHAGGMLIVEEVGCKVTDLQGNPVECGLGRTLAGCHGMIVAPASIHQRLVEAVRETTLQSA